MDRKIARARGARDRLIEVNILPLTSTEGSARIQKTRKELQNCLIQDKLNEFLMHRPVGIAYCATAYST